jgi:peptidylprolyl isomerase
MTSRVGKHAGMAEKELPTRAALNTSQGRIELKLFPDVAPKAVENFTGHIRDGYYDGVIFHRVIPQFMIQGGDPTGTGRGGESIWGKPFEDETTDKVTFDREGILAMANAGPGTNGSQFFITTGETSWLQGNHTIFGEVVDGYDVVEKVESAETDAMNRPKEKQVIESAEIIG